MENSSKNIVITGATGLIGQALSKRLLQAGYSVTVLSRNPANAKHIVPDAEKQLLWAPGVDGEWKDAIDGAYAVVHLAGESLFGSRWTESFKKQILESRVHGTNEIADAILASENPPKVLVTSSAIGYYGDTGDREVDETTPPGDGFLSEVCAQWEGAALRAKTNNTRVIPVRTGLVLSTEGGVLGQLVPLFKLGLGGWLGNGRQWFSWVHLDDVTGAMLHAIETPSIDGPINAVSPNPVTNKQFSKLLGTTLRRPVLFPVPGWALRIIVGEFANAILSGQKVVPTKLAQSSYVHTFPELSPALTATT